jgi:hypothetical protein
MRRHGDLSAANIRGEAAAAPKIAGLNTIYIHAD